MKNNSKDLTFITFMQIIGCFLVVFGHSFPFVTPVPSWADSVKDFVYCFHMPLFVWCSGYLLYATDQTEKYSFKKYTLRRAKHILLPYFLFSIIALVPKILLTPVLNDELSFDIIQITRSFLVPRDSVWGHFWFLPMIFILNTLGYLFLKLKIKFTVKLCVVLLVSGIGIFLPNLTGWFSVDDVIHFSFYFFLGMLCSRINIASKIRVPGLIGIFLLAISVMMYIVVGNQILVEFIISVLMILSVFAISVVCIKKFNVNRNSTLAQTYQIFILSWPCQLITEIVLERILNMKFYVIFPSMILVGVFAPMLILKLIDYFEKKIHCEFLSIMIGR